MGKYLIGLDNGGTMSKAAIYDLQGKEIAVCSRKTEMYQPEPGFTERNCEEMWAANVGAIRAVLEQSGISGEEVMGIAATGHGNGLYLIGADGKQTYNGMISTDSRGKEYAIDWMADGPTAPLSASCPRPCNPSGPVSPPPSYGGSRTTGPTS